MIHTGALLSYPYLIFDCIKEGGLLNEAWGQRFAFCTDGSQLIVKPHPVQEVVGREAEGGAHAGSQKAKIRVALIPRRELGMDLMIQQCN